MLNGLVLGVSWGVEGRLPKALGPGDGQIRHLGGVMWQGVGGS